MASLSLSPCVQVLFGPWDGDSESPGGTPLSLDHTQPMGSRGLGLDLRARWNGGFLFLALRRVVFGSSQALKDTDWLLLGVHGHTIMDTSSPHCPGRCTM